jgi:hypothetical protein
MVKHKPRFKVGDRVVFSGMTEQRLGFVVTEPEFPWSGYSIQLDGPDGGLLIGIDEDAFQLHEPETSR